MNNISDCSYGIIPLRKNQEEWEIMLVQHVNGSFWGFPKGHAEEDEDPQTAARRELKEETNLAVVNFLPFDPLLEKYQYQKENFLVDKKVFYFLAEVAGDITKQIEEIASYRWVNIAEAVKIVTYPSSKNLCQKIFGILNQ